ncbi:MAG: alpha-E domain-containing protein [Sandaracinus sp.]|nr:alpha-E domain-containing protein [Sandaracinus sp.]
MVDISRGKARKRYDADRDLLQRLRDGCDLFLGLSEQTLLDDEPLRLHAPGHVARTCEPNGAYARREAPRSGLARGPESPVELAQWSALLYSCSASEAYKRVPSKPDGRSIAAFLLQDPALPRSVIGCLLRARATLERIRQVSRPSSATRRPRADGLIERLRTRDIESIFADSIHDELTHAIDTTSAICAAIDRAYVDPGDQSALVV